MAFQNDDSERCADARSACVSEVLKYIHVGNDDEAADRLESDPSAEVGGIVAADAEEPGAGPGGIGLDEDLIERMEAELVRRAASLMRRLDESERLEEAIKAQRRRAAEEAAGPGGADGSGGSLAVELAGFDFGEAGERLRRYQFALQRDQFRALGFLMRIQAQKEKLNKARRLTGEQKLKPARSASKRTDYTAAAAAPAPTSAVLAATEPEPIPAAAPVVEAVAAPVAPIAAAVARPSVQAVKVVRPLESKKSAAPPKIGSPVTADRPNRLKANQPLLRLPLPLEAIAPSPADVAPIRLEPKAWKRPKDPKALIRAYRTRGAAPRRPVEIAIPSRATSELPIYASPPSALDRR